MTPAQSRMAKQPHRRIKYTTDAGKGSGGGGLRCVQSAMVSDCPISAESGPHCCFSSPPGGVGCFSPAMGNLSAIVNLTNLTRSDVSRIRTGFGELQHGRRHSSTQFSDRNCCILARLPAVAEFLRADWSNGEPPPECPHQGYPIDIVHRRPRRPVRADPGYPQAEW